MKKILIILFVSLTLSGVVSAHQPRLVVEDNIVIENPEVSQAFYATLEGESDTYTLTSPKEFLLLTEILNPVIEDKEPGLFSYTVRNSDTDEILLIGTTSSIGEIFYEPFAGDEYVQGSRYENTAPAGEYELKVTGEEGKKYVLVVGKRELFPFKEILNTYKSLPSLKMDYFEKPFYTIFTNPTGAAMLVILGIVLTASLFSYRRISIRRASKS